MLAHSAIWSVKILVALIIEVRYLTLCTDILEEQEQELERERE